MNLTHYFGVPGSGKTTLMREKISKLKETEEGEFVEEGLVKYHRFPSQKTLILGIYDDRTFSGTDAWSKGVGPKFRVWLQENFEKYSGWSVFSEGERLSNKPNLDAMFATGAMELVLVDVSQETLNERRAARNNTQNESWMKGMETRIRNLCAAYPHTVLNNN
jgi:hypothetical protein